MNMQAEFQVKRRDLTSHRIVESETAVLQPGEIRLTIDKFAFTANNLTYGAAGDLLGYWHFFTPADNAEDEWGILPVWGFADVVESNVEDIPVGERLYGYFPPATSVVMQPAKVSSSTVIEGMPQRQKLPPLYNRYRRVFAQRDYTRDFDDATILLAPLHLTSFCIADQLKRNRFYDAKQVLISSASSKTSLGLAFALSEDSDSPRIVGLTSERNMEFVESLGLYDQVVAYDVIPETLTADATVVVDMAGNPTVTTALDAHLGESLNHYISVGLTHWDEVDQSNTFGPASALASHEGFFAPAYILELLAEWGPGEFESRTAGFMIRAAQATFGWMTVDHREGLEGLASVYADVSDGTVPPSTGVVVELQRVP
jgi:hypothetical protein